MSENQKLFALLIDGDHATPVLKLIPQVLNKIKEHGNPTIRRVYGNENSIKSWATVISAHDLDSIPVSKNTKGKNVADFALVIAAMELVHSRPDLSGFCIITSDGDFTELANHIKAKGKFVLGIGADQTPESFIQACSEFVYVKNLSGSQASKAQPTKRKASKPPTPKPTVPKAPTPPKATTPKAAASKTATTKPKTPAPPAPKSKATTPKATVPQTPKASKPPTITIKTPLPTPPTTKPKASAPKNSTAKSKTPTTLAPAPKPQTPTPPKAVAPKLPTPKPAVLKAPASKAPVLQELTPILQALKPKVAQPATPEPKAIDSVIPTPKAPSPPISKLQDPLFQTSFVRAYHNTSKGEGGWVYLREIWEDRKSPDDRFATSFVRAYDNASKNEGGWVHLREIRESMKNMDDEFESHDYQSTRLFAEKAKELAALYPDTIEINERLDNKPIIHYVRIRLAIRSEFDRFRKAYKHAIEVHSLNDGDGWVKISVISDVLWELYQDKDKYNPLYYRGIADRSLLDVAKAMRRDYPDAIEIIEHPTGHPLIRIKG